MKKKQTKWTVLEMFLTGPGTRMEVWKRNPEVIQWETFKRVSAGLLCNGLIETIQTMGVGHSIARSQLTAKGRKSVEEWRRVNTQASK